MTERFIPVDHGGSEDPSLYGEEAPLLLVGMSEFLNISVDTTAEGGDGDIDPASAEVTVIDDENTFVSIDDDGLDVTVSADATPGELAALDLNVDETIDPDDDHTADGADVYNPAGAETEPNGVGPR